MNPVPYDTVHAFFSIKDLSVANGKAGEHTTQATTLTCASSWPIKTGPSNI